MDLPSNWFTIETLATLSTATIALRLVVEFTKDYIDQWTRGKLPTQFYALLWALVILFGVQAVQGIVTVENAFLNVFNAFLMVGVTKMMDLPDRPKPE